MRIPGRPSRLRYLPAFLGLLVPIATLAWLGNAELGRQRERAARAMLDHASVVVENAEREVSRRVESYTSPVLGRDVDARFEPLVQVDERISVGVPHALGLIVLDDTAELVYPATPPDDPLTLPFVDADRAAEVRAAEQLIAAADFEGARGVLEDFLDGISRRGRDRRTRPSPNSYRRALFRLGTVYLRLGSLDEAESAFDAARRPSRGPIEAAIPLLSDALLAEIDSLRDPVTGAEALVEVMRRIACGEHYVTVGDDLLTTTLDHLRSIVDRLATVDPNVTGALAQAQRYIENDRVRTRGRSFALEYRDYLRESVRRLVRARGDAEAEPTPLYVCHADPSVDGRVSLLALRPVRAAERDSSPMALGPDAAWIGMRFDFEAIFEEVVTATARGGDEDFYLAIESADGTPILPRGAADESGDEALGFEPPRRRSLAGMVLRAEPADPEAFVAADRRSRVTRALLILALCGVAGGGAWLLVRSAARESEIAAVKMQLVSRVSHELRTPIALIKMYAETIARDTARRGAAEPDDATQRFTAIIDREADRLAAMVQRILDFSRAGSSANGGNGFRPETVDLAELVTSVTDAYRPRAVERGVDLAVSVPRREPVLVDVDRTACENALLNLLENAVKYSHSHSRPETLPDSLVEVDLRSDGARQLAILTVADRGIGIPEGELDAVFDSFYRASNANEAPGVGLGLHLVRNFAQGHGGDAVASLRDGLGTIITCSLPLHPQDEPPESPPTKR